MAWNMRLRRNSKSSKSSTGSCSYSLDDSSSLHKIPKRSCLKQSSTDSLRSDCSHGCSTDCSSSDAIRRDSHVNSESTQDDTAGLSRTCSHAAESLDARVSKSSECLPSQGSNSSCSKSKAVRFSVVEIRDYERDVGDNPSCSDGCPIGIGWTHASSRVVPLKQYESSRPYRKGQLEMVLTREEREELLTEWGASQADIVSSTRALNKAKHQRRQTVRNLNKAQVEEGIEAATRKLKNMLSLKKGTKDKVKELQYQADIAAARALVRYNEMYSEQSDATDRGKSQAELASPAIHEDNGSGALRSMEVKLGKSEKSADVSHQQTMPTSSVAGEEMDAISCISGFTLGNSTTASARAIEKFHQELEMELFGDQDLPSMVGKTLEVDVDIPEEERVYHDPSPICGTQEPPSVTSNMMTPVRPQYSQPAHHQGHVFPQMQTSYNFHGNAVYGTYQMQYQNHPYASQYNFRVGGSLGSEDCGVMHVSSPQTPDCYRGYRLADRIPYSSGTSVNTWSTNSTYSSNGGPRVAHVPLGYHLSPNSWMDGTHASLQEEPIVSQLGSWEAVVISEDDCEFPEEHFVEQTLNRDTITMR